MQAMFGEAAKAMGQGQTVRQPDEKEVEIGLAAMRARQLPDEAW